MLGGIHLTATRSWPTDGAKNPSGRASASSRARPICLAEPVARVRHGKAPVGGGRDLEGIRRNMSRRIASACLGRCRGRPRCGVGGAAAGAGGAAVGGGATAAPRPRGGAVSTPAMVGMSSMFAMSNPGLFCSSIALYRPVHSQRLEPGDENRLHRTSGAPLASAVLHQSDARPEAVHERQRTRRDHRWVGTHASQSYFLAAELPRSPAATSITR